MKTKSPDTSEELQKLWRDSIHELNNSLAGILGHSALVARLASHDPHIQDLVKKLRRGTQTALELAERISSFESYLHIQSDTESRPIQPSKRVSHSEWSLDSLQQWEGPETIFLVEDDTILQSALTECLEHIGYTVITANNGEDAIRTFQERYDEVDLVCVDLHLPHSSGLDVSAFIRTLRPTVRIVLMSGIAVEPDDEEIYKLGFSDILTKPVELHVFARSLRKTLDGPPLKRLKQQTQLKH